MPAISATAPGKIILFGEHAVVYGQPAIAAPINQVKARAIISARPDLPKGTILLQAPNIGLEQALVDMPGDHPLVLTIHRVLQATGVKQPPALSVRITSTIPIAAGMGSGAAVSVAITRALSKFLGHPLQDKQISQLAFEVEKLYHGTPSGIDNSVITYERPIFFTRHGSENVEMEFFQVGRPFTIVIGDSGILSPTSTSVGDVRKAWLKDQETYEMLFNQTGEIVRQARKAIENGDNAALGPLMEKNQELLRKIGVSCDKLEQLIHAAHQAGALGAKLSGGGRGGNMIALTDDDFAPKIANALIAAGATNTMITKIIGKS